MKQTFLVTIFLLLSMLFYPSSSTFVVSDSPIFPPTIHPSTNLFATYSQLSTSDEHGYHIFNLQFNTTIPSINLDQTNGSVSSIECDPSTNSITLILSKGSSKSFIDAVVNWPDKVMLLISHKWSCFGRSTTQFYLVGDKTVDSVNRKVKFNSEPCEVLKWTNEFSLNLSWVNKSKHRQHKHRQHKHSHPSHQQKRATLIDKSGTITLDGLFDPRTGKTSRPNITLNSDLVCANCFTHGSAKISLKITGFGPIVNSVSLEINGDLLVNIDITTKGITLKSPDVNLLDIPITFIDIPGILNIGPSLILEADAQISLQFNRTVSVGGNLSIPDFDLKAQLSGQPEFDANFKPKFSFHKPDLSINKTVSLIGSLKLQLALEVNALGGLFSRKAGVEVVSTLGVQVDSKKVVGTLGGDVDFFLGSESFPIVKFPNSTFTKNVKRTKRFLGKNGSFASQKISY
ncbi:12102_t:CDS:1 [Acaulospora morrowiae]|uniref:12102_t:CDS:1 n=1 Tax=Acaulospora morrowiae TaxID=94023 RepID=A0A9N9HA87_9GLOM|nr:12102_t:CDS:1 [Acaulospora morrowiae]